MNPPTLDTLALAISQVIQVTALILIVGVAARFLRRRHPHLVYLLWCLVLVKAVTPPLFSHSLGIFSRTQAWTQTAPVKVTQLHEHSHSHADGESAPFHSSEANG